MEPKNHARSPKFTHGAHSFPVEFLICHSTLTKALVVTTVALFIYVLMMPKHVCVEEGKYQIFFYDIFYILYLYIIFNVNKNPLKSGLDTLCGCQQNDG